MLQTVKLKQTLNWYDKDKKIKSQTIEQIMRKTYLSLQISFSRFNQTIWIITRVEPAVQKSSQSNGEQIRSCNLKNVL